MPFGEGENKMSYGPRVPLYLVVLLWLFLGVGIISDKFMEAIEQITSETKDIELATGAVKEVKVRVPQRPSLSRRNKEARLSPHNRFPPLKGLERHGRQSDADGARVVGA